MTDKSLWVRGLLQEVGTELERGFYQLQNYAVKKRFDLRSECDLQADQKIKAQLEGRFPQDGIYSEESSEKPSSNGQRWIIDPIDGTSYFIFGEPFFSISLAREVKGVVKEAYVYNPITQEFYFATASEEGAYLNDGEISVSRTSELKEALLAFGFSANPAGIKKNLALWGELMGGCKKALPWIGPALSICSVAKGRVDGFLDTGCSMEGQAAAAFILQKAGGQTRDLEGEGYSHRSIGGIFTNGALRL
jgi:myo-inositol-1(or 4)-monophosphatase